MTRALYERFSDSVRKHPERDALVVDGETYSYRELDARVRGIAATLRAARGGTERSAPTTCVLASRSLGAYAGVLGALASGHAYVPIAPEFPVARVATMLVRSEARELIVDAAGAKHLPELLAAAAEPLVVLSPQAELDAAALAAAGVGGHQLLGPEALANGEGYLAPKAGPEDAAYLLFTSGSTGTPKGVRIDQRNISRFLDFVVDRYALGPDDRFSQMFDLTFDLSLFDLFGAWSVGACVCCPDARARLLPGRYIEDERISIWFSVPSAALLMKKSRLLEPGAFPGLRWSLFCGEALSCEVAEAWMAAAPGGPVENLYGPTELTLACTLHRCVVDDPDAVQGLVPIGEAFEGMRVKVVDAELRELPTGEDGELIVTGPQMAPGYWRDAERTAAAFVVPPGETERFYRTGDRVRRSREGGPLCFLGRVDHQIKIRGHRVELGDIEAAIRRVAEVDAAVALGWPPTEPGCADGVVAFVDDAKVDPKALRGRLAEALPRYMQPREIRVVEAFPLNSNGKIDRKQLRALLDGA